MYNGGFLSKIVNCIKLFHGRGPYHIGNSPLICSENQLTGFYIYDRDFSLERVNRILNTYLTPALRESGTSLENMNEVKKEGSLIPSNNS